MSAGRGGSFSFLIVMLLALVIYSVPLLRDGIGHAMDLVIRPLVGADPNWIIVILTLATVTGCYSSLIQKYTIDYEKMQRVQKKIKAFQKTFREAQLAGDEKRIKKLKDRQDKVMQEQMEMSQEQFKPMAWIMIITVPIFLWLLYVINITEVLGTVTFPFWGEIALSAGTPIWLPAWILWYMICSLTFSQVIRKALNIGGI
ncbi:MAG: DUF106 domain-containing protein [Methanomicrobiaceae archaeon]|nr:DUF106 domain-containing protein [Methanomicrobiaceae archaeon]